MFCNLEISHLNCNMQDVTVNVLVCVCWESKLCPCHKKHVSNKSSGVDLHT